MGDYHPYCGSRGGNENVSNQGMNIYTAIPSP